MKRSDIGPGRKSRDRGSTFKQRTAKPPTFRVRACLVCGEEYMPTVGHQKYCSAACRLEGNKRDFTCDRCGSAFRREPSKIALHGYCSHECASSAASAVRRGGVGRFGLGRVAIFPRPARCIYCRDGYEQKRAGQRFCSRECLMKHRHQGARPHGMPAGWGLKAKGEDECRNCGAPAEHLHHIVPRSKSREGRADWQLNGMPLCARCHRGWHDRTIRLFRGCLRPDEFAYAIRLGGRLWVDHNYPLPPDVALIEAAATMDSTRLPDGWRERNRERIAQVREVSG